MKRFTDAEKWSDPWFRRLTPQAKLFWMFLLDNCDNAGVWERDDEQFLFFAGMDAKTDVGLLIEELQDRVFAIGEGRIVLPKFVVFQQGEGILTDRKPFHRGILRLLERHGLTQDESGKVCHEDAIGMPLPCHANGKGMAWESHEDAMDMATSIGESIGKGMGKGPGKGKGSAKGKGKDAARIPEDLDVPKFRRAWTDYLNMRKERKHGKLAAITLKKRFEQFQAEGVEASVAALDKAVLHGWRGVFFEQPNDKRHADDDRNYDNPLD